MGDAAQRAVLTGDLVVPVGRILEAAVDLEVLMERVAQFQIEEQVPPERDLIGGVIEASASFARA